MKLKGHRILVAILRKRKKEKKKNMSTVIDCFLK